VRPEIDKHIVLLCDSFPGQCFLLLFLEKEEFAQCLCMWVSIRTIDYAVFLSIVLSISLPIAVASGNIGEKYSLTRSNCSL
jgi:hypothetical protein